MDLKIYNYIINGLEVADDEIVEQFKSCLSNVKGVIKVEIDASLKSVKYAIDEWTSEYEVFSTLNEICNSFNFELSFEDEDSTVQDDSISESDESEVIEELQVDESFEEDEKEEKKGKLTAGDVIEKSIILGISVILLIVGAILSPSSSAKAWILMLSFTVASYETLYDVIIKIAEKKYFVEELMVFVSALIFMYLGKTTVSAIIMLVYAVLHFGIQIVEHYNTVKKEKYDIDYEECDDEAKKAILKEQIDYLKSKENEIDKKSAKIVFSQLKYNVIAIVIAILTVFIPPFFSINQYWTVLADKWLYAGATVLLLGSLSEVIFAFYNVATLCILNALAKQVKINLYNAFLNCAKAESICFDSVGTLTEKKCVIESVEHIEEEKFARIVLTAYSNDQSGVAKAIVEKFKEFKSYEGITDFKKSEFGVSFNLGSNKILVGNKRYLKSNGIIANSVWQLGEVIFACENGKILGNINIKFDVKKDSFGAIKELSNDLELKTIILCSESVERATFLKTELEADSAVSGANTEYKVSKVQKENGIFVGANVLENSPLSTIEQSVNFGKNGSVTVENDEIRTIPYIVKLSKRADKTLNFAKYFTAVSKILLFATTFILSIFTSVEFALVIFIIDSICKAISVANTLRNATSVA